MKHICQAFFLIFLLPLSGCLEFGDDIELEGKQVDSSVLENVERITGIALPEGTVGLNYLFLGSGIDDALWLKVIIPEYKKAELFKNQIFDQEVEQPDHNMTLDRDWWSITALDDPTSYSTQINNGTEFLGCTIGTEKEKIVLYILWFST